MKKKLAVIFSVLVILVFIGYIIIDLVLPEDFGRKEDKMAVGDSLPDKWKISRELKIEQGSLRAVSVSGNGNIYLGGDSFVLCYDNNFNLLWNLKSPYPISALSNCGDTIFAATMEKILVISSDGKIKNEWGPFEDNAIITSIASERSTIAFADAGNRIVFILDKTGDVKRMIGQNDGEFIVPSPYFDLALGSDNTLYIANTGHRRVETRTIEGELKSYFGEPGTAPGAFCGCCNPAHFAVIPQGVVTAEKGINRIKILDKTGKFIEYVSSKNRFMASVPLDLASADGKSIYAANPADSKLYIFTRK